MVVRGFALELAEVQHLQLRGADRFGGLDFNAVSLAAWKRLLAVYELKKGLPSRDKTMVDLFKWAELHGDATAAQVARAVAEVTTWDAATVETLVDRRNLDLADAGRFGDERALAKLAAAVAYLGRLGVADVGLLLSWTDLRLDLEPTWELARSVRQAIRARYTASDYEQAIRPAHDTLRQHQRDALVAHLVVQPELQSWGVADADGLFEFFLLDVQAAACAQTSRTKQAVSSVQLFVQRCMLGLEERHGVANDALDAGRWASMAKQAVWAANRKVFLWPENWLVPSLRDDKTPPYVDAIEAGLLQRDVKPAGVLDAFGAYVAQLAQVAALRAVGVHVETADKTPVAVHCVAMTVSSPFRFHHRKYALGAGEWTPWVDITVDIPTYSVEFASKAPPPAGDDIPETPVVVVTGCYVAPVAWRTRTLLFIGQVAQKATPNDTAMGTAFGDLSTQTANAIAGAQVWEVRLGWTEYRAAKWTPKQLAFEPFQTPPANAANHPAPDSFQFLPRIVPAGGDGPEQVAVDIFHTDPNGNLFFDGQYIFDGTVLRKGTALPPAKPKGWLATSFHLVDGRTPGYTAYSLQQSPDGTSLPYLGQVPNVSYASDVNGLVNYLDGTHDIFYHPLAPRLTVAASAATELTGIDPIEHVYRSLDDKDAVATFGPVPGSGPLPPDPDASGHQQNFSELSKPYTNYNWELGFHAPMQVADALLKSQQFDLALNTIHQVFNPYADGPDTRRVWQWAPFKLASSKRVIETLLNGLKPQRPDVNIARWRHHPFQPFVVARGRTVAYMKWTVAQYLRTLVAYGDMYFRRRTLEDIPLAVQLYLLASRLYGPRGETIPRRGKQRAQTFHSLMDKWDAFSNAAVQMEIAFPFSNQSGFPWGLDADADADPDPDAKGGGSDDSKKHIVLANLFGLASQGYFCLPSNPELSALRDTIDQRLYNIRHCLDIDGRPLPPVLWEPPIDPSQAVAAVASGLSLSSAVRDLNASLPNYRFTWLLARALEAVAELKSLEGAFLSIKEKRDGEALQRLRTAHEISVHKMVLDMKKVSLQEANNTLDALRFGQQSSKQRHDFYSRLAGIDVQPLGSTKEPFKPTVIDIDVPKPESQMHVNETEAQFETAAAVAQSWTKVAGNMELMASILHALPCSNVYSAPLGCGIEVAWGMPNLAFASQAVAGLARMNAGDSSFSSGQASRKASYLKQHQDRLHQMNLAGLEYEHLNTQVVTQQARIKLATLDIATQEQNLANADEVDGFLRTKYTNDDLYAYLEGGTRNAAYQTYLLAYDLAKKAELAFKFERRPTSQQARGPDFVSFGYYDAARDGLTASQGLYLSLKAMDQAWQCERGHDYEVVKSVSLRQVNPYALLALRETGTCTFDVPEVLFDMDFPGHYYRRIKTLSLTIPCVAGPHVGVNATLRLLKHKYRADPRASSSRDYAEDTTSGGLDPRMRTAIIPTDAVAAGTAQNDSGSFELSLKDERYVPFEGAGVVSTWQITLPPAEFRPFDYASIADVALAMRYTSCEGGAGLRAAATGAVADWIATVEGKTRDMGLLALWDIRAEFAAEWAKLSGRATGTGRDADVRTLVLRGLNGRLPAFVGGRDPSKVRATDVSLVTNLPFRQPSDLSLDFKYVPGGDGGDQTPFDSGPVRVGSLATFRISETDETIVDWALKAKMPAPEGLLLDSSSRMWLIVRYRLLKST